jgi:hypothetical protein
MLDLMKNQKLDYSVEIEVKPDQLQPGDLIAKDIVTLSGETIFEKQTIINDRKIEKINSVLKTETLREPVKILETFGKRLEQ